MELQDFLKHLKSINHFDIHKKIAIGVSGGPDSLCLAFISKLLGFDFTCLVIDHGLRPESQKEALYVKKLLDHYNIKSVIFTWQKYSELKLKNLHHKARKARYDFFIDYCKNNNITQLMTAHHLDDQAETVLMRIARGSGIDGICGIQQSSILNGILIVRPFLKYRKKQLEEFLQRHNVKYISDPSNQDQKYTRTRVRFLIDENQDLLNPNRISLLSKNASRARSYLEEKTQESLNDLVYIDDLGYAKLNIPKFLVLHEEIGLRVLNHIFYNIGKCAFPQRLNSLEALWKKIQSKNKVNTTLGYCRAISVQDHLIVFKEEKFIDDSVQKLIDGMHWDNRFIINHTDNNNFKIRKANLQDMKYLKENELLHVPIKEIYSTLPCIIDSIGIIKAFPAFHIASSTFQFIKK